MPSANLSALCLAAGRGTRLDPITRDTPKALCPAGDDRLLDRALRLALGHAARVAVNAHHLHEQIVAHLSDANVEVIVEPQLLGTGGAVGNAGEWLGGDDLMLINADTVLNADTTKFVDAWDRRRLRMLVVPDSVRADFEGMWRYVGVALIPNRLARSIPATPSNLSEELFVPARRRGEVELVPTAGFFVDCATPADLLAANLALSGGATIVADGARLEGTAERSLLMPGAVVRAGERIEGAIRLADGTTVHPESRT